MYALTVAKGGPKLQASKPGSCVPLDYSLPTPYPQWCGAPKRGDGGLHLIGATMADLCTILSAPEISDRAVIDRTGIAGMFDIQLPGPGEFHRAAHDGGAAEPGDRAIPTAAADAPFDAFVALSEAVEKLGLKLERAKGSGGFFVIEHVERPSEN